MRYSPKRHLYNIGLSLSQLGNALLGGDPDESLSGRCGKGRERGSLGWTIAATLLDVAWWPFERDHCRNSIERDEGAAAALGERAPLRSRLLALLLAIVLIAWFLLLMVAGARAQTVTVQRVCAPSHVVVAVLRGNGLAVVETWLDDQGWPIEVWSDGGEGRAVVLIAADDTGALLRCLVFAHSPVGEPS
jgi:hypothetical protein